MAQVLVRNLDDDVVASLRRRASAHGHSLEQELRDVLTAAARTPVEDRLAAARSIRLRLAPQTSDSAVLIRQDRDSR